MTVLNGNGVTGSASNASYLLGQRGYPILTPPNGIPANAPTFKYFRTDDLLRSEAGGCEGGRAEGRGPLRLGRRAEGDPGDPRARERRDADDGRRADVPRHARLGPGRPDAEARAAERRARRRGVARPPPRAADAGRLPADGADGARAVVLDRPRAAGAGCTGSTRRAGTRRSGSRTRWARTTTGACRSRTGRTRRCSGAATSSATSAAAATSSSTTARTCTWSCSSREGASYWVVNTLLDRLSNETMLAIAKGLRPVAKVRAA